MQSTMQDIPLSLASILTYGATVHGDTRVTTWESGNSSYSTFAEVGARAAALAHALHDDLGITGDQRVGTFMDNCTEHLETILAVPAMGAVLTPLNKNLMDSQIQHMIRHAEVEVIVADPRLAEQLRGIVESCPSVRAVLFTGPGSLPQVHFPDAIGMHSYEALLDGRSTVYEWPTLDENTAAALCYSTGTTGPAKPVAYSHRSMYLMAMELRTTDSFAITEGESFLCCVPIFHVLSWGVPYAAFMAGAPLIFPGADLSPTTLADLIATTHPRVAHGVPTVWIQLIVHYLHHPPERMSLVEIYVGGSPAPPILIRMWEERYGVDVIHVWGMTETSTVGTVSRPPAGVSGEARWTYRISQGRFPASLEYRVVNDGKVVSATDRNQGEIQVRGNLVAARYADSTGEQPPEQFTADGWLRTGDVGSVTSDGYLTIHDRARDVIRSGGEWIYSALLENLVMEAPEVVEAAVIGYPDKKWGERPLVVTVLHGSFEPTAETAIMLRERLRASIPHWMLPEYWTFVENIDKTSVNKFDKKDLRKHLAAGEYEVIALPGPGEKAAAT
ncbi:MULTISPECIES: long-chain fatty-acid--CoA ligase [unclassified Corynebacterium]|uniref:long-chain fatty-acid--CoA ligase n=1 Tax=unclassified Corynebacterium TaxID=2624378 RepID=UPI0029CA6CD3|nr:MULTISPECIES: long-chain fatty-acid--CoA ligase [unclassified Corynebacterium]WPF67006.1 long-chain fatty-acid--CoA ligase [Corynebacterium sp. 22KM0430]WPF69494.1 long-chain fatty-acid--CoA ligase [Corynebacterium sp. 21KM1197]